ncbi:unnamed protein product [Spirodela intermedia]|uniref:Protein TIFY n=1 Tax=Spirodela intermedia TaxID=51605 RepID=A0A7I8INV7_SPIIN|nr:unnamed protein product [Spirodela intermedia]CAA6659273.1 unnamed protein product [Spirodela intermedia]
MEQAMRRGPSTMREELIIQARQGKEDYNPKQLTIFFNGEICVLEDIPPEKVQAILIIAAATAARAASPSAISRWSMQAASPSSAASTAVAGANTAASLLLSRSPSFQSSSVAVGGLSPRNSELLPNPGGSLFKLQALVLLSFSPGLPLVRRSSLQQFLEKRRDRLVSRAPYVAPTKLRTVAPTKAPTAASPPLRELREEGLLSSTSVVTVTVTACVLV